MAACAGGTNCDATQAANARDGLAILGMLEADQNYHVILGTGATTNQSPVSVSYSGNTATLTLNPNDPTIGVKYSLAGLAVHEAHENYEHLSLAGGSGGPGSLFPFFYDPTHDAAVRQAEDPARRGAGLPTRTSRRSASNPRGRPCAFGSTGQCP